MRKPLFTFNELAWKDWEGKLLQRATGFPELMTGDDLSFVSALLRQMPLFAVPGGETLQGRFMPMRLLVFVLAVTALFFIPNPEWFIVKVVEFAGLVLIVARGLVGRLHLRF